MAPPRGSFAPRGSFSRRGGFYAPRGGYGPRGFQHQRSNFNTYGRPSGPVPHHNAVHLQEKFTWEDIKGGNVTERLNKIMECLSATISDKTAGHISLRISAMFIPTPVEKNRKDEEVEGSSEKDEEIVKGLEDALKEHLEKRKRIMAELPDKIKKLRESQPKTENGEKEEQDNGDDDREEEDEKETEEETDDEVPVLAGNQKKSKSSNVAEEISNNQAESAKKTKKQRRTESESSSNIKAKKQKTSPTKNVITPKQKRVSESENLVETTNSQTPGSNKKQKKNSFSENTPFNEKTPNSKNSVVNSSLKLSKKKKRKSHTQESEDYLPL